MTFFFKYIPRIFKRINNTYSSIASLLPFRPTPFVLKIRITEQCNLSCDYCFLKESLNKKEHDHFSKDEWDKIFSHLPFWTNIDITGGEPFSSIKFKECLEVSSKYHFKTSVTTNGYNISDQKLQWIFDYKLNYLMVSLDGLEEIHDPSRGKKGAFKSTLDFLDRVHQEKKKRNSKYPIINIKFTLTNSNYQNLPNLTSFLTNRFGRNIIFTINLLFQNESLALGRIYNSILELEEVSGNTATYVNPDHVLNVIEEVRKQKINLSFSPQFESEKDLFQYLKSPKDSFVNSCSLYKNNITLYYNGMITACSLGLNLGNIREMKFDIRNVYQNEKFTLMKSQFTSKANYCQGCCYGVHSSKD